MELAWFFDILKLLVPTLIALGSLLYAYKQRQDVKEEILKKRYLENALANLNEAIKNLRGINIPNISSLKEGYETWGDAHGNAYTIATEILRASYELKTKKVSVNFPYEGTDYGEWDKPKSKKVEYKELKDFSSFSQDSFIDHIRTHHFRIETGFEIPNFEQFWSNGLEFDFLWNLRALEKAKQQLLAYEEVYENISLDSVNKLDKLFEEIAVEILRTIRNPKSLKINLEEFSNVNEIMKYLYENVLNYSFITKKFSNVPLLISELTEARKELFLKISP